MQQQETQSEKSTQNSKLTRNILRNWRTFWRVFKFQTLRFREFPLEAFFEIIGRFGGIVLPITLWFVIAEYSNTTIEFRTFAAYFFLAAGISHFLGHVAVASEFIKQAKRGELNSLLVKPVNLITYMYGLRYGFVIIVNIVAIISIAIGLILITNFSPKIFFSIPIAFTITLTMNVLLSSVAFYLKEASGIKNTYYHFHRLFGGLLVPLFFLPTNIASIFLLLPFAHTVYVPTQLLQNPSSITNTNLITGAVWAAVLSVTAYAIWHHSIKRYDAVGT